MQDTLGSTRVSYFKGSVVALTVLPYTACPCTDGCNNKRYLGRGAFASAHHDGAVTPPVWGLLAITRLQSFGFRPALISLSQGRWRGAMPLPSHRKALSLVQSVHFLLGFDIIKGIRNHTLIPTLRAAHRQKGVVLLKWQRNALCK